MRSKYFLSAFSLFCAAFFCLLSCTNAKKVVKQMQAFSATTYPGIVAVDETGKEMPSSPQTKYTVFVVTTSTNISWDTAWINGEMFKLMAEEIKSPKPFDVGVNKQTGEKILIQASENEHLFRLQLTPVSTQVNSERPSSEEEFRLKAVYKRRVVMLHSNKITEVTTPDPV